MMKKKFKRILRKVFLKNKTVFINTNTFAFKISKYYNKDIQYITLIDVGANRGIFFDELQKIFSNSIIEALLIEPIPECILELKKKYSKNKNVTIGEYAVSNVIENREFFINRYDVTSSLLIFKYDSNELKDINTSINRSIKLITNTLDNIIIEEQYDPKIIDIIKIDVQGFEDRILLGAKEILKRTKFIWIEVSFKPLYNGSCLFHDVHKVLCDLNFVLVEIIEEFRSPQDEILQANCLYKNIILVS